MSTNKSLQIDYDAVNTTAANIKSAMGKGDIVASYGKLIEILAESKGQEATALKSLLGAEKELAIKLNDALTSFGNSIQAVANEFKTLDSRLKSAMK